MSACLDWSLILAYPNWLYTYAFVQLISLCKYSKSLGFENGDTTDFDFLEQVQFEDLFKVKLVLRSNSCHIFLGRFQ